MYIANAQLKIQNAQGKIVVIEPGEEVVGFESWPEVPRRAHLSQELVIRDDRPSTPKSDAPDKVAAISPAALVKALPGDNAIPLVCGLCGKTEFKTDKALKAHVGKAHRKAKPNTGVEEKAYYCEVIGCEFKAKSFGAIEKHQERVHRPKDEKSVG